MNFVENITVFYLCGINELDVSFEELSIFVFGVGNVYVWIIYVLLMHLLTFQHSKCGQIIIVADEKLNKTLVVKAYYCFHDIVEHLQFFLGFKIFNVLKEQN